MKMLEYYHADRLHYPVARNAESARYDRGFFVKQGDGAANVKPAPYKAKSIGWLNTIPARL
jgi:NAD+ synthase